MMLKKNTIFACGFFTALLPFALTPSFAANAPVKLAQYDAWGAYAYKNKAKSACYVLSLPVDSAPENVTHGDNFFLISERKEKGIRLEPQFMAGYMLKPGSHVTVDVKNQSFDFFIKKSSAWLSNSAQERKLIAAMRSGAEMTVHAVSKRGTHTSYTYSLKGLCAALKRAHQCH